MPSLRPFASLSLVSIRVLSYKRDFVFPKRGRFPLPSCLLFVVRVCSICFIATLCPFRCLGRNLSIYTGNNRAVSTTNDNTLEDPSEKGVTLLCCLASVEFDVSRRCSISSHIGINGFLFYDVFFRGHGASELEFGVGLVSSATTRGRDCFSFRPCGRSRQAHVRSSSLRTAVWWSRGVLNRNGCEYLSFEPLTKSREACSVICRTCSAILVGQLYWAAQQGVGRGGILNRW